VDGGTERIWTKREWTKGEQRDRGRVKARAGGGRERGRRPGRRGTSQ
jgi:hypothetical protein